MSLFGLVHSVSAFVGVGAAIAMFGPWTDRLWELKAAMWFGALGAVGSGVVISLSAVGTDFQIASGPLLGKVALSILLLGVMYTTLTDMEAEDLSSLRLHLGAITVLWVLLLGGGVILAV